MNAATKLGAYVVGLAVVFGGALGVGSAVGEAGPAPAEPRHEAAHATPAGHGGHDAGASSAPNDTPGGLQVSQNGYTLNPLTTVKAGEPTDFRFTVTGPDGEPVTDFQVQHDKKLHFIVVSRDLTTFRHLHPVEAGDGVWSVRLTLKDPGAYRAFADFLPTGGTGLTLGTDLLVAGDYEPRALPEARSTATVDGYTVSLAGNLIPGQASKLTLSVSKDGEPVTDLQPYLGAYGHLVALRAGDLAYLHVHPEDSDRAGPDITFYAEVPSSGDYRLFLDFKHGDEVRTADFTARAGTGRPEPTTEPTTEPSAGPSHGDHTH
ncbi:hypothetical protein FH608_006380 [Nonomuraea phyllanthi]|uniref:Uncharacterized protein n=1 Tax=Nonomuraea phyllanthi TaxID=2219224 RepID=A0A5C4WU02_9ACTN|nr:hypothetical protein [Nonomuraea phyllanthi]KAB8196377.1 hypothetical protein FH608_006380 [Nonomuraea phyllanthi]QFY05310.1 hypothetical protein GBF35_00180 [Nonomuraea phyllanthi]